MTSENSFETAIIENLSASGGYSEGDAGAYSPEPGIFAAIHGEDVSNRVLARLYKERKTIKMHALLFS